LLHGSIKNELDVTFITWRKATKRNGRYRGGEDDELYLADTQQPPFGHDRYEQPLIVKHDIINLL
jgi:hypothetical protein